MNPFKKELYVAIHAQSARFRLVKYAILVPLFAVIYRLWGREVFLWTLGIAFIFAIAMHLFYRWMTNGWQDSWGGYKSLFK
jgi:hypothetical protein